MADKAFLNGINDYQSISDLRGCVNDVKELASLLVDHFGFNTRNVRKRFDKDVNKKEIQSGWEWLLSGAKAGDRLVFHFSGHGSYTVDEDGDEEGDRRDELLCLFDMDWSDPGSYLLDDELRKMTEEIPEGVLLTVLLDSCHSGTGTRLLVSPPMARSLSVSEQKVPLVIRSDTAARAGSGGNGARGLESGLSEGREVLARFVEPPEEIRRRAGQASRRKTFFSEVGRGTDERPGMNHVLFAGCQDDQTSADASISGTYRGAFTHGFCEMVKEHGKSVEHQSLIKALRAWMQKNSFSQVPQLEPETAKGPLFSFGSSPKPAPGPTLPASGKDELLVELMQELLTVLRDSPRQGLGPEALERGGTRHLVYVHGICEHRENYSQPWWEAMKPHLSASLANHLETHRQEVNWSNIVNDRAVMETVSRAEDLRAAQVAAEIKAVLEDRSQRAMLEAAPLADRHAAPESLERAVLPRGAFSVPGLNCADDFARYLTQPQIRRQILNRFLGIVRPVLEAGGRADIISHSWGTVIAYEGLRELDDAMLPGRVLNLFTVGSALSIWPVKKLLAEAFRDGRKPRHVGRWTNLDAQSDAVGGQLMGNPFQVDEEFLGLYPVGCEPQGFWQVKWFNPSCAHSSYFHRDNQPVNRDIFARFINNPT